MSAVIDVRGLTVTLSAAGHARPVLDGVDLAIESGRCVGIVGESGSGKSLLSRALLGDLPRGAEVSGRLELCGVDVLAASPAELRRLRRDRVAMIHQDPRAAINPLHRVGDFLTEGVVQSRRLTAPRARERALDLLERLRIRDPRTVFDRHPDQLSGGMLQRVMIAAAMMAEPDVILCDEATTALDVTTQHEIVGLLTGLVRDAGVSLVFVTHDLELAGDICDEIAVLYAGQLLERAPARDLLAHPHNPYTAALLQSTPTLSGDTSTALPTIPGIVLPLTTATRGCVFADRCAFVQERCTAAPIAMLPTAQGVSRCIHDDLPEGVAS